MPVLFLVLSISDVAAFACAFTTSKMAAVIQTNTVQMQTGGVLGHKRKAEPVPLDKIQKVCVCVSVVTWPVANMNILAPVINGCYDFFTHFTCDFFTISAYLDLQPRLEKVIETAQVL